MQFNPVQYGKIIKPNCAFWDNFLSPHETLVGVTVGVKLNIPEMIR